MTWEPLNFATPFFEAGARAVEHFEARYLDALLRCCGGNLSKASRQARLARHTLRALLKKRGLYDPGATSAIGRQGSGDADKGALAAWCADGGSP